MFEKFIGEVYTNRRCAGKRLVGSGNYISKFVPFKKCDIQDTVDKSIKIYGVWFNKSDIFLYDDIYNPIRNTIKKRNDILL